jgi:aspartyl-tRNA(Asn)/glutamyl-tRNA(Gln) amidotransferase subunit C
MASKLTRDDVLRVAELARLELTDDEIARFTKQLDDILTYADAVQQADTSGIPPTAHPLSLETVWRDDTPVPSLDRDEMLRQAPAADRDAGLYKVPKVL